jgi:hypothetical protein
VVEELLETPACFVLNKPDKLVLKVLKAMTLESAQTGPQYSKALVTMKYLLTLLLKI